MKKTIERLYLTGKFTKEQVLECIDKKWITKQEAEEIINLK